MKKLIATWSWLPVAIRCPNSTGRRCLRGSANRVEEGDRQRPALHREDLADGQVGELAPAEATKKIAITKAMNDQVVRPPSSRAKPSAAVSRAETIGTADHRLAPDRVEETAEERAEKVGGGEEGDVKRYAPELTSKNSPSRVPRSKVTAL